MSKIQSYRFNSEWSLGCSNACREDAAVSPAEVWLQRLLADQTCRLVMMRKVADVCVQIAYDEVLVFFKTSPSEKLHIPVI